MTAKGRPKRDGLETLHALQRTLAKRGGTLVLCRLNRYSAEQVARAGFMDPANVVPHLAAALFRAHQIVRDTAQADSLAHE